MRQMKVAVGALIIFSCIVTAISHYWNHLLLNKYGPSEKVETTIEQRNAKGPLIKDVALDEVYKYFKRNDEKNDLFHIEEPFEEKMLDTTGCKIPSVLVNYVKYIKRKTKKQSNCGKRAIFLKKFDDNSVQAFIKDHIIQQLMKHKGIRFDCCYQFVMNAKSYGRDRKPVLSNCTKLKNNSKITLQSDFIKVKCYEYTSKNISYPIYDDMYAFASRINISVSNKHKCNIKYNVLMIGMDSMSLSRARQTLPRTVDYFKNNFWMNYRGYHKIGDNTFPNLMAALTGKNMTTITKKCSGQMDNCNHLMIWHAFKEIGYVTAYGEDNLQLPDTFTNEYEFRQPPTDHYIRPFFLKSEYRHKNSTFICTGKTCSGQQILDYALDFAHTYRKQSFFGVFWINSFSHDANSQPQEADKMLESFFKQLTFTEILTNTFVIFFSDHGIRFGEKRFKMEAYYDDRKPMFFMRTPVYFKNRNPYEHRAIANNQYRLITPYDIYSTLLDIKQISICNNVTSDSPKSCPNCHSTFKVISDNRTCQDASIHEKWCTCHKLYPLPVQDPEGIKSVDIVVKKITAIIKTIKTKRCWACMGLTLKVIIRIHFYHDTDGVNLYYVVAFVMAPGNASYEATVLRKNNEPKVTIVGPISTITKYRGLGKCAINHRDRLFCVCQKIGPC